MGAEFTKSAALIAAAVVLVAPGRSAVAAEATADLVDADSQSVGTVALRDTPNGIVLHAKLDGLPAGSHAFHVHAVGVCEPPFASAGGHHNPGGKSHGFESEAGPHAGDFASIHVPPSGALEFEAFNARIRLDETLLDADGAAIVIHASADDYSTDPAGAAGSRIACGVIVP